MFHCLLTGHTMQFGSCKPRRDIPQLPSHHGCPRFAPLWPGHTAPHLPEPHFHAGAAGPWVGDSHPIQPDADLHSVAAGGCHTQPLLGTWGEAWWDMHCLCYDLPCHCFEVGIMMVVVVLPMLWSSLSIFWGRDYDDGGGCAYAVISPVTSLR